MVSFRRDGVRMARRGRERRRRIGERVGPWALYAMSAAFLGVGALHQLSLFAVPAVLGVLGIVMLAMGRQRDPAVLATASGAVSVEDDTITIETAGKTTTHRLAELETGFVDGEGRCVLRWSSGDEVVLELSKDDAHALLETLDQREPDEAPVSRMRAARLPIGSIAAGWVPESSDRATAQQVDLLGKVGSLFFPFVAVLFSFGAGDAVYHWQKSGMVASLVAGMAIFAATLLSLSGFLRVRARRVATVGADGIQVRSFRDRFIPWSSVDRVERSGRSVDVHLLDGSTVTLPEAPGGESLHGRIKATMRARRGRSREAGAHDLDRGERSVEAWREHLKQLGAGHEGYREARVESEQLAAVVADPDAPPDRRVGAAVMLGGMNEPARKRVRIAIDACAEDEVKTALERALEGEIAEDEIEAAEKRRRGRL